MNLTEFKQWCDHRSSDFTTEQVSTVHEILSAVRNEGDSAVRKYTKKFSATGLDIEHLRVNDSDWSGISFAIYGSQAAACEHAVKNAIERVRSFHENQKESSWITSGGGVNVGQRITPIDRVGIYVPGGQATLLSTLIMCAVPAQVAGVKEIAVATPPVAATQQGGAGHTLDGICLVCKLLGISELYTIGGAQAIAALAYGTESVPAVDKIVGPGNAYVSLAKKMVFGEVGIDMIAGPSEVMVICDETANPQWVAADLLAQLEHGSGQERAVCVSWNDDVLDMVKSEAALLLAKQPRKEFIKTALAESVCIKVANPAEAIAAANAMAPEHLELAIANPQALLDKESGIRHAGAIFIGHLSCETLGDYVAGPNHTLPTNGTARFSSPLGVYDFVKRSSTIIAEDNSSYRQLAQNAITMAEMENLIAHAQSMKLRVGDGN